MGDLEAGRARMEHALPGVRPPRRVLVLVTRGDPDTRALTHDVRTPGSLTALAEARVSTGGPARRVTGISGQRVLVLWRSFGRRSTQERRMVIAHELTHAALARQTSGRTPAWLVEGTAMYASGDQRAGEAGALLSGAQLVDASQQAAARRTLSLAALAKPDAMSAWRRSRSPRRTRTRPRRPTGSPPGTGAPACCGSTGRSTTSRSPAAPAAGSTTACCARHSTSH
jgi:hypothetical protein